MELTVIVPAFGAEHRELARTRAVPSAELEGDVIIADGPTVAASRNAGAAAADTEWIVFLDADDELEPGFAASMAAATADVRVPWFRHCRGLRERPAVDVEPGPLRDGNMLPIGCVLRRDLFHRAGGFREWTILEDWDLWQRVELAGATFESVPGAVYRAYIRSGSRNRSGPRAERIRVHHAIRRRNYPELYLEVSA